MIMEVLEPRIYNEAVKSEEKIHWKKAVEDEMTSLKKNCTWPLVDLPENQKVISNRRVYTIKGDEKGNIVSRLDLLFVDLVKRKVLTTWKLLAQSLDLTTSARFLVLLQKKNSKFVNLKLKKHF